MASPVAFVIAVVGIAVAVIGFVMIRRTGEASQTLRDLNRFEGYLHACDDGLRWFDADPLRNRLLHRGDPVDGRRTAVPRISKRSGPNKRWRPR